jgi:hypothetical protein
LTPAAGRTSTSQLLLLPLLLLPLQLLPLLLLPLLLLPLLLLESEGSSGAGSAAS